MAPMRPQAVFMTVFLTSSIVALNNLKYTEGYISLSIVSAFISRCHVQPPNIR